MSDKHIDDISGVETTGHEWDGIRELNNPMPRWWVWTFYATIVWAIGYTIAFPAWPLISGSTQGLLGWHSRAEFVAETTVAKAAQNVYLEKIASSTFDEIKADPELMQFAVAGGAAASGQRRRGRPGLLRRAGPGGQAAARAGQAFR